MSDLRRVKTGDTKTMQGTLGRCAELLWSPQADTLKEQERRPDFSTPRAQCLAQSASIPFRNF
jgi:hypothetical protein